MRFMLLGLVACAVPAADPDCDRLANHVATVRASERVQHVPDRDRPAHQRALIAAVTPALRHACEQTPADQRACLLQATTKAALDACKAGRP